MDVEAMTSGNWYQDGPELASLRDLPDQAVAAGSPAAVVRRV